MDNQAENKTRFSPDFSWYFPVNTYHEPDRNAAIFIHNLEPLKKANINTTNEVFTSFNLLWMQQLYNFNIQLQIKKDLFHLLL